MTKFDKSIKKAYRRLSEAKFGDEFLPKQGEFTPYRPSAESAPDKSETVPLGMVPCEVDEHHSAWLVKFEDGCDILLQSDYDQAAFATSSADYQGNPIITAPKDWDGTPSSLPGWEDVSASDIAYCLSDYHDQAEGENEGGAEDMWKDDYRPDDEDKYSV